MNELPCQGVDHPYERAVSMDRHTLGRPDHVLRQKPNAFAAYPHEQSFGAYLRALSTIGVECLSAVERNHLTAAGAPYVPIGDFL